MLVLEAREGDIPELEVDLPLSAVLLHPQESPLILAGSPFIQEEVGGLRYRISAQSFFQVNTAGAEALVETVTSLLEPRSGDRLLDGYCGGGLFALALARHVHEVIGVESDPSAALDFFWNAESMGLDNVTLIEGPVDEVLAAWAEAGDSPPGVPAEGEEAPPPGFGESIDLVIVDPPRRGLGPDVIAALGRLRPRRVAYVSCDPATLARDTQKLIQAGYGLAQVQPVDMFPQTFHVESVGLFTRET
jgi:23S rRNA (uracil1939-C5)-methyltransferase